jgi:hypothetical protein
MYIRPRKTIVDEQAGESGGNLKGEKANAESASPYVYLSMETAQIR